MSFADGAFSIFLLAAVLACSLLRASAPRHAVVGLLRAALFLLAGELAWAFALRPRGPMASPIGAALQHLGGASLPEAWSVTWALGLSLFAAGVLLGSRATLSDAPSAQVRRARVAGALTAAGVVAFLLAWRWQALEVTAAMLARAGHPSWLLAWGVVWGLGRRPERRATSLQGALFLLSAVFYHAWAASMTGAYRYLLGLILATVVLDYFLARAIESREAPGPRRAMLVTSLVANLGVLAAFKYADFVGENLAGLGRALGAEARWNPWRLILPAGISFHTFQSLSYTVDVYRRRLRATASLVEFATFVLFFPQLVAGPIVRAEQFLPQIAAPPPVRPRAAADGLCRIVAGMVKKLCLADTLAATLVDRVFAAPSHYSSAEVLLAVLGYALQIYLDFSAYSDIAVGAAALLGFELPENFRAPYLAEDLSDFWRRWHISLSTWLRDYLYIPLGGNREGEPRTYRNLLITMLLGGLWHGAAWTFIVWGALHGAGLAVTRAAQRRWDVRPPVWRSGAAWRAGATVLTLLYVCVAWVFFRATSFANAREVFAQAARGDWDVVNVPRAFWVAMALAAAGHAVPHAWEGRARDAFARAPWWLRAVALVAAGEAVRRFAPPEVVPFIYFQF